MCNTLTNPILSKHLTKEELANYTKALLSANLCLANIRNSLEAYSIDPKNQQHNLKNSLDSFQNLISGLTDYTNSEQNKKTVSEILLLTKINEEEVNRKLNI